MERITYENNEQVILNKVFYLHCLHFEKLLLLLENVFKADPLATS